MRSHMGVMKDLFLQSKTRHYADISLRSPEWDDFSHVNSSMTATKKEFCTFKISKLLSS